MPTNLDNITALVIGLFNAALGTDFEKSLSDAVDGGMTMEQLGALLEKNTLFTDDILGGDTSTAAKVDVLMNHYGLTPDGVNGSPATLAADFFTASLDNGDNIGKIVVTANDFLLSETLATNFPDFQTTAGLLKAKITVAKDYSETNPSTDLATLQTVLAEFKTPNIVFPGDTLTEGTMDIFVMTTTADSQISDTNGDGVINISGDSGFLTVAGFETGSAATADLIDVSAFGFATDHERDTASVSAKITNFDVDLTSITDLFEHHGGDHGVATARIPLDSGDTRTFVFIDANHDGDFTAADDAFFEVQVTGGPLTPIDFIYA